jgi:hypothetical protein
MVVFFFWFAFIWMFIALFADILRRDISGWAKAGWILLLIFLPFVGVLAYVVTRPRTDTIDTWGAPQRASDYRPADEIAKAAMLHDQGKISADEFEQIKRQVLATK